MKGALSVFIILIIGFAFISSTGQGNGQSSLSKMVGKSNSLDIENGVDQSINSWQFPLYFVSNQGQVHLKVRFYAKAAGYTLWLTRDGLVFDSIKRTKPPKRYRQRIDQNNSHMELKTKNSRDVSRLVFIGANNNLQILPVEKTGHNMNYFIGNDRSKWHANIPTFSAVLYKNIYKNIDLKVYGIEKQIEYDWIVRPGGDPNDIRFEYQNVKNIKIDKTGNMVIVTGFGRLRHKKPACFQRMTADIRKEVKGKFKKLGPKTFGFDLAKYDHSKILVIDPLIVVYSSYLGGSVFEEGRGIAVDTNGYAYVTGYTGSTDFPTLNQYQSDQGVNDVFVSKIDTNQPGAASLLYSTYLGGNSSDIGMDIAVDNNGIAYITGYTSSTDFPTLNQYMSDPGDSRGDIFVTKLDTTQPGAASFLYSTYLGGSDHDLGLSLAVDSSGIAYILGHTNSTDFPTLNQYQVDQPLWDASVSKIDTTLSGAASLLYSTYLGGNSNDFGPSIAVDNSGNVYVTGETTSTNFPILNQYQSDQIGYDAFVTRLDTSQSGIASLVYSTYLGGNFSEVGRGIAVDNVGHAYITGYTYSTDFPLLNSYQAVLQGSYDAFITRIDTASSGAASLLYSTYLGGTDMEFGLAIATDTRGGAVVAGYTDSSTFPVLNQYQSDQGGRDIYVSKIDTTFSGTASLIYSTYLGGGADDYGNAITLDNNGDVYVTGHTNSTDFPTLNQYQGNQADTDAYITRFSFNLDLEVGKIVDNATPSVGDTVTFTVTVTNNGPGNASGLTMNDALPSGLTLMSSTISAGTYTGSTGDWDIGPLANGANATLQLQAMVARGGIFTNSASISSLVEDDGTPGNNTDSATITTQHRMTASVSGGHGRVSPGNRTVAYGSNVSIDITPDSGYRIASIRDNGRSRPIANPFIIRNVSGDHEVVVNFEPVAYTINASVSDGHGNVSPASQEASHGGNVSIEITPENGYMIASITDNGVLQPITNPYLITNIATNHIIIVTFKPGVTLGLTAVRKTDNAWIISRDFGELQLTVSGLSDSISRYKISRSTDGGPFEIIKELAVSQWSSGSYQYLDTFLSKNKMYKYKFAAYDLSGNLVGESLFGTNMIDPYIGLNQLNTIEYLNSKVQNGGKEK